MKLEKNEYTTQSFLEFLEKKFGKKMTGAPFDKNDIFHYIRRGYTPYRYGGLKLKAKKQNGVRIIIIGD